MKQSRAFIFFPLVCAVAALLACGVAAGQPVPKLEFEVATIKPVQRHQDWRSGQVRLGAQIHGNRAEYRDMSLRQLVAEAHQVRPFQVVCPEWFLTERFDVIAKTPADSRKEDAPLMLQSLLAERFKLAVHRESKEEDVMALVVGKAGPNLVESPAEGEPPQGAAPAAVRKDGAPSASFMMGTVGVRFTIDQANSSVHWEASRMTMTDLAHLLMRADQGHGRPIVDMTGLKGRYEVALDMPLALTGITNTTEENVFNGNAQSLRPADAASDPASGRMTRTLKSLGLELKKMKAPVEHLVVDRAEKTPIEN